MRLKKTSLALNVTRCRRPAKKTKPREKSAEGQIGSIAQRGTLPSGKAHYVAGSPLQSRVVQDRKLHILLSLTVCDYLRPIVVIAYHLQTLCSIVLNLQ